MSIFRFKKFSLCDDKATMKLGTDAVLLGSWANVLDARNLLDIGSGCGIIALMLAQRTNEDARIDAVELLSEDVQQCSENVARSPWPGKISVHHSDIKTFITKTKYDCILCNPPFFSNSLLPPAATRQTVRHELTLSHHELLEATVRLLSPDGRLNVILPTVESLKFIPKAIGTGLFPSRHMSFFTRPGKRQERSLLEFSFHEKILQENSLILYQKGNQWTEDYRKLTEPFYLDR